MEISVNQRYSTGSIVNHLPQLEGSHPQHGHRHLCLRTEIIWNLANRPTTRLISTSWVFYSLLFHHMEPLIFLGANNQHSTSTASLPTYDMIGIRHSFLPIILLLLHGLRCITTITFLALLDFPFFFSMILTALLVYCMSMYY